MKDKRTSSNAKAYRSIHPTREICQEDDEVYDLLLTGEVTCAVMCAVICEAKC